MDSAGVPQLSPWVPTMMARHRTKPTNHKMKKLLLTLSLAAVSVAGAHAQILFEQNDFTWVSGNLAGQNGWAAHSGAGSLPVQVTTSGSFTLAQGSGSREDVNRDVGAFTSGNSYYAAFILNVSGTSSVTNSYFAHFLNGTANFRSRVWVTSSSGSDYTLGFSNGSSIESTWATGLDFNTDYTVVFSYTQDTGAASLWINPVNFSSTSISAVASLQDPALSAVAFRQAAGNTTQIISNLVVGTDFNATLAAVPEPSTYALRLVVAGGLLLRLRFSGE